MSESGVSMEFKYRKSHSMLYHFVHSQVLDINRKIKLKILT